MGRDFSELRKYAIREYKFNQDDSFGLVRSAIRTGKLPEATNEGVCMGVALMWINEKLSTSNSYVKSEGRLRGSTQREFSNSINPLSRMRAGVSIPANTALGRVVNSNPRLKQTFKGNSHARNEATMMQAAEVQQAYAMAGVAYARTEMKSNFQKINAYRPEAIAEHVPPIAKKFGYNNSVPKRDESATIARAA